MFPKAILKQEEIYFENIAVTDDTLKMFQIGYKLSGDIQLISVGQQIIDTA